MKTPENKLSHLDLDLDLDYFQSALKGLPEKDIPIGLMLIALGSDCQIKQRDVLDLIVRFKTRGISSLAVDLPLFFSCLLTALEENSTNLNVPGFKKSHTSTIPAMFQFQTYQILNFPDAEITTRIFADLYQFCSFFKKMELDSGISDESRRSAAERYVEIEDSVFKTLSSDPLLDVCRDYSQHIFHGFNVDDYLGCHGPGTVSDCKITNKFNTIPLVPDPISMVCGFANHDHFVSSLGTLASRSHYDFFAKDVPSEFLVVPKDARGPRTICREPLARQMYQQLIRQFMEERIECSPLTKGYINFSDQSVNGKLALESSLSGEYATIDLKDASDMLSYSLAHEIFTGLTLWDSMCDARSSSVIMPGEPKTKIKLNKFAPMGSAICFTTLSYVCWVLCRVFLDAKDPNLKVYVYGDDLVVPVKYTSHLILILEHYGLKVNRSKSFSRSKFRESCGTDAYNGVIVTPVKLRREMSARNLSSARDSELASLAATVHLLWDAGRFRSAFTLSSMFSTELPPGNKGSNYICLPESLVNESLADYVSRKRCGYIKVTESGRRLIHFTGLVVKTKTVRISESDISYFYRRIVPSIGIRNEQFGFLPGLASEFRLSESFGKMDIHKQTTITRSRLKVII